MAIVFPAFSQSSTAERFSISLVKATDEIEVDGKMDEPDWQSAQVTTPFYNHRFIDHGLAKTRTEVRLTYDDRNLYLFATMQSTPHRVIQSLKRDDLNNWRSDAFFVVLDPINEQTNGFVFGINSGGAQLEAALAVTSEGVTQGNWQWDTKWFSEVTRDSARWTVEMAIPFESIRYKSDKKKWGINFARYDPENTVYSTWTEFPLNFIESELGYTGSLHWDHPPAPSKKKYVLIPYSAAGYQKDYETGHTTRQWDSGLDGKLAISPSLNLDLSFNPNFSNADIDQQVTNLSRFSIFFPERRSFFLENGDLFSNFGNDNMRPFFSRKVGLEEGRPVPLLYGVRLSGNLSAGWRIGAMNMNTESNDVVGLENYSAFAVQKRVMKRSSIKAIYVGKESGRETQQENIADFNRTVGAEFEYLSEQGQVAGYLKYHRSFTGEVMGDQNFFASSISYNSRRLIMSLGVDKIDKNFVADLGFVPRLVNYDAARDTLIAIGFLQVNPSISLRTFHENSSHLNYSEISVENSLTYNEGSTFNEHNLELSYTLLFHNRNQIRVFSRNTLVQLPFPINFAGIGEPLPVSRYHFLNGGISYQTNRRGKVYGDVFLEYGEFYTGDRLTYGFNVTLRQQPWGNFLLAYSHNRISLPEPYGITDLYLVGPKAEIAFSTKLLLTTFIQYNTQAENLNLYSRLQWRYLPQSDVFVVYSDNYSSEGLGIKNRSVDLKITYWF